MAKISVTVITEESNPEATVCVTFTHDVSKATIMHALKNAFEIELNTAEIKRGKYLTSITLLTRNKKKITAMQQGMVQAYRSQSGLGPVCMN